MCVWIINAFEFDGIFVRTCTHPRVRLLIITGICVVERLLLQWRGLQRGQGQGLIYHRWLLRTQRVREELCRWKYGKTRCFMLHPNMKSWHFEEHFPNCILFFCRRNIHLNWILSLLYILCVKMMKKMKPVVTRKQALLHFDITKIKLNCATLQEMCDKGWIYSTSVLIFFLSGGADRICNMHMWKKSARRQMLSDQIKASFVCGSKSDICQCIRSISRQIGYSLEPRVVHHWKCNDSTF